MAAKSFRFDDEPSISEALRRVVDGSQHVMLAHLSSIRLEVKEELGRAVGGILVIGAGVILINGAWLSLMAFVLHGLSDQLSLLASLAIVGGITGLIGVGLALVGARRLRPSKVEVDDTKVEADAAS